MRGGLPPTPLRTRRRSAALAGMLHESLVKHGIGDFQEAADVGAVHEIAGGPVGLGGLEAGPVDGDHDLVQPIVHFLAGPVQPGAVLRHLEARGGYTAGVRSLGRPIEDFRLEEQPGSFERARHVGAFGNDLDPVVDEVGRVFGVDFVLGGAGERAISFDVPQRVVAELHVSRHEDRFLVLVRILANAAALHVLQFHDPGQLLTIDAVRIVDYAVGIGDRDRLRAEIKQLLDGVLRDIAAAGYQAGLAIERFFAGLQHFLREVHAAVAGGFRTDQRTAPVQPLAGEHASEFIPDALVLAEQETDLASAHADIAGGNVGVRANVAA